MIDACQREVVGLHEFFVEWFTGQIENSDEAFDRVARALGSEFVLIGPDGRGRGREVVLASIRGQYGRRADFTIEIRNFQPRLLEGGLAVVVYEEHQVVGGKANARISSAVFRGSGTAPEKVAWIHLHETALTP